MKRIEMTGPSGVGKTTLYNFICGYKATDSYITRRDVYIEAARREHIPWTDTRRKFLQLLLRLNLVKGKHLGIAKRALDTESKMRRLLGRSEFEVFSVSFHLYALSLLRKEENPVVVSGRISSFIKYAREMLLLSHLVSDEVPVLIDEGITFNFSEHVQQEISNYTAEELQRDPAITPYAVISCEAPAETIFEQAKMRKRSGVKTFSHGALNDEELYRFVKNSVLEHNRKIDGLRSVGVPVLKVDTRSPADQNRKKIETFIESLVI